MEMRELLSFYDFDGDNTPIIRGSALGCLLYTSSRYVFSKVKKDKGAFKNNFILLWLLTRNYRLRQD